MRIKRKTLCLGVIIVLLLSVLIYIYSRSNMIEEKLTSAIDQICAGEGECILDLNDIFTDFEWDTVSIFMAGNSKQVIAKIGVDPDVSNGIAFSKNGVLQQIDMSTYDFPMDAPPHISYSIEQSHPYNTYCISLSKDRAKVKASKYLWNGVLKYSIWLDDKGIGLETH